MNLPRYAPVDLLRVRLVSLRRSRSQASRLHASAASRYELWQEGRVSLPSSRVQQGVVSRLRTLLLALDRQDRLETAAPFVGWLDGERRDGRLQAHAREMLLRALKVASDPVNFAIISSLDTLEPVELPGLMQLTGLERVAVSERVNDLVQTGLAVREMSHDQVRGTDLSQGLVAWIEEIASGCGSQLTAELTGDE